MTRNKFGRPKKRNLDHQKISIFLNQIGFEVERIDQQWRHLLAFGKYKNNPAVFKLASTQQTAKRTQNEFYWNEAIHLTPHSDFTVPQNFSFGYYGKLFYFIAQKFEGKPLVKTNSLDLSRIQNKISQIARVTREIGMLTFPSDSNFAKYQQRKNDPPVGHKLLASTTEWASQVPLDLDDLIRIVQQAKETLKTCPGHGDFVGRQMYDVDGKIGLIDGEHAGIRGPLYYDVAQFYIRLRNDHQAKELATIYLHHFKKLLSLSSQKIFWEELKPVLIQRYIGDLWGSAQNPLRLKDLQPLGEEIRTNQIC